MAAKVLKQSTVGAKPPAFQESDLLLQRLAKLRSREFVFAVVGYAGSGTSFVAGKLRVLLSEARQFPALIKAREALDSYAALLGGSGANMSETPIEKVTRYQDLGDGLREKSRENAAVAAYMIRRIRVMRGESNEQGTSPNVFILDSLKHPAEVRLLREVYGENFCLIGVGCRTDIRQTRLGRKLSLDKVKQAEILDSFINRDAEDSHHKYGQQVNDTFHLADYFVDNSFPDELEHGFVLPDKLKRLAELLFSGRIHRPENDEKGLYHAHAASLRSACLSRQVGASILDCTGNLLAVGCNDVPRFGGGLYSNEDGAQDDRCFRSKKECSNTVTQKTIVRDLFDRLNNAGLIPAGKDVRDFDSRHKG